MKLRLTPFNNYLVAAGLLCLALGCASSGSDSKKPSKKEATGLRLFLETSQDPGAKGNAVPIYRAHPMPVNVERTWFIDEGDVMQAAVVDVVGGFAIQIQFNFHGALALENATVTHRGLRIAVWANWNQTRWLAAPMISAPLKDGVLTFTPDATREESDRIVRGLNNLAEKLGNKPKSKDKS